MKIIIVGTGTVGSAICAELVAEGHSITVIDKNSDTVEELSSIYDITGIVGSGADIDVLKSAGIEKTRLLIAITSEDELNILCCLAAKKLGCPNTIARIRTPELVELTKLTREEMGLTFAINPEYSAAREIARILRLPSATKVDTFCGGRVEMVEFTLSMDSPIAGKSLLEIRKEMTNMKFLFAGISRDGEMVVPRGDTRLLGGDVVTLVAADDVTEKFFKAIKAYIKPVKNVLIAGGGKITYYLSELLQKSKTAVTVIEKNPEICLELAENSGFSVINGDGTRQQLLLEEGIESADAFISLLDVDDENAITSMYANSKHVPKVITLIRSLPYIDFFRGLGLSGIISPKSEAVNEILRFVRSTAETGESEIKALYKLMDDKIEALEFTVKESVPELTDIPLKDIKRNQNTLIACIVRGDEIIIPSGSDCIKVGDSIIVVTTQQNMDSIKDILS